MTWAQDAPICQKNTKEVLEIKFNPANATNTLPNYFIDKIATALPKIRMYTKVFFNYEMHAEVRKTGNTKYELFVRIDEISYGGNFKYKNFDFSKYIAPAYIEQTFEIFDQASNKKHWQKIRVPFKKGASATSLIEALKGVYTSRVSLKIIRVKPVYDDAQQKADFEKAATTIDAYYRDVVKLDELKRRIQHLDISRADVVALRNVDLKYIEKDLAKIPADDYIEILNLKAYDPARFILKYDSLKTMITEKRRKMNEKMNRLEQVYYNQALVELNQGNRKEAIELLQNSIRVNPYFTAAQYQLALLDFEQKQYQKTLVKLQHLFNEMKPDEQAKAQSRKLAFQAYDSLMHICELMNQEERFNDATRILYETKSFCDSTADIQCDERLNRNITNAVYGLYASYLSIARASLDNGSVKFAQYYFEMAQDYKSRNTDILNRDYPEAKSFVVDLIDSLVQQSTKAGNMGEHQKAKELLTKAKSLCRQYKESGCMAVINRKEGKIYRQEYDQLIAQSVAASEMGLGEKSKEYLSLAMTFQQLHPEYIPSSIGTDTIEGKVRYIMYQEHITNGLMYLRQKDYITALGEFDEARDLQSEYVFPKNDALPSYFQQAAKPLIMDSLKLGALKAWGKFYDEARHLLNVSSDMSREYYLSKDTEVQAGIRELQLKIQTDQCDKLASQYSKFIRRGNNSEQFKDYYYAAIFWQQALQLGNSRPECALDVSLAKQKLTKYQYDIRYAQLIHQADSLRSTQAAKAFELLKEAEDIRQQHQKELQNPNTPSLLENLISYNDESLNRPGIAWFIENQKAEAAYKLCVHALESQQQIPQDLQEQSARLLARYDRQKGTANADLRFGSKKVLVKMKKAYSAELKK